MVRSIHTYTITPALPDRLARLHELAYNLWWTWDHEASSLFRRLDRDLWEQVSHNPVRLLGAVDQQRLLDAAQDEGYLTQQDHVLRRFDEYMANTRPWYGEAASQAGLKAARIGYFCMEFGLGECLPIYSGGMGVLAGDHLKSASELGLPLVAVGLLYQEGYFQQYLNADGWQQERYPDNDFANMPLILVRNPDQSPLTIQVSLPGRMVTAQIWKVQVGRIPLYLLDTNSPVNTDPADRDITDRLYGGDTDMRIRQEIVLGIGGVRALEALGLRPAVTHMNEGHSAFLGLERIRLLMEENQIPFAEARELVAASSVFTTHTPVPAGIDLFSADLMGRYFGEYARALGFSLKDFLALGRQNPNDEGEPFSMAVLAIRLASEVNGVSRLHGKVARKMWQGLWPSVPEDEVPIQSITNGIHHCTWVAPSLSELYERYMGARWHNNPAQPLSWEDAAQIPDEELWHRHETAREQLVVFLRQRLRDQLAAKGATAPETAAAGEALNPYALTIVFARRFATYKRATLLFHDPARLAQILGDPKRPVQIVYAGKAHPQDNAGRELIRQIVHQARDPRFGGRVVFLENYDMNAARFLTQGADVWLNNPRRPLEASGTSGMKAAVNCVLNVSVLDGWWAEGYKPEAGWAIGRGEEYQDLVYQDEVEANALYDLLEKEVIPTFYDRGRNGMPRSWVARMKGGLQHLCPVFNTTRMVHDYAKRCYLPASRRAEALGAANLARARALAAWKARLAQEWRFIRVSEVRTEPSCELKVGGGMPVSARVHLGNLTPDDVLVQVYEGPLDSRQEIVAGQIIAMTSSKVLPDGDHVYVAAVPCSASGERGYALRVLPQHPDLCSPFEPRLILWA
jgi:starch phosphorylase